MMGCARQGATTPTARQRLAVQRKRTFRLGVAVALLVAAGFMGSLFLVDLDEVDKQAADHHELQVRGGKHPTPPQQQQPNHSREPYPPHPLVLATSSYPFYTHEVSITNIPCCSSSLLHSFCRGVKMHCFTQSHISWKQKL
jgi:hypothetical protein